MLSADKLIALAEKYQATALEVSAKERRDPKAEIRNRGKCIFPAEKSRDHTDHFPINNIEQARAALRYAGKQKLAPWYHGTVEEMKKAVERAVHSAFPKLKHEKKSSINEGLITKYAGVEGALHYLSSCTSTYEAIIGIGLAQWPLADLDPNVEPNDEWKKTYEETKKIHDMIMAFAQELEAVETASW
jgi:hypothetical protein